MWILGRVENSKMFQNQIAQCFFIGFYDIETGDDFYFFQKFFFGKNKNHPQFLYHINQ